MRNLIFGAVLCGLMPAQTALADPGEIITAPAGELEWSRTPEGVAFAGLIGDRFKEDYMAMVELPAGLVSPAHTKSANMYGVVISGTITHVALDAATGTDPMPAKALSPGSFYMVPAGLPHVSSCISESDCVTFLYQDGMFDFVPVEP